MRNIKLILEYDGTEFHGWQRQRDTRTVQGVVEEAIRSVFQSASGVVGAGRTDTGVHALDYPCNFHVDTELSLERIRAALGAHLPEDVVVKAAFDTQPEFHARFDALSRRYAYALSSRPTAIWRRTRYNPRFSLDPGRMAEAAALLVGEHDFTSFTPAVNEADPVCRVSDAAIEVEGALMTFTIEANRFLHHMVRIIVGTLIDVGRGHTRPEHVETVLCRKDRREAGATAPPHGLSLVGVRYPESARSARYAGD
jgi:tRNA pseudouridine38-40 synthase